MDSYRIALRDGFKFFNVTLSPSLVILSEAKDLYCSG